jgi:hypothetical protein
MLFKTLSFDDFWLKATSADKSYNGFAYHSCCDSWTSRAPGTKRATHSKQLPWRKLMATLDKSTEDKKQALLAKMTEESWRVPVIFNAGCQARPAPPFQHQTAFRLHGFDQPPQQPRDDLTRPNFIQPLVEYSLDQDACTF